ncbi:hypothetical protein BZA77DRAFT_295368 [Pyronema omphalodes]|nr:hypothetical protein BZA77DRAFT_295368 [Pyronema omphalodes]
MRTTIIITSFLATIAIAGKPEIAHPEVNVKQLPIGTLTLSQGNLFLKPNRGGASSFSVESLPAPSALLAEHFPSADASLVLAAPSSEPQDSGDSSGKVAPRTTYHLPNPLYSKSRCWGPAAPLSNVYSVAMDLSRKMDNWCCQSERKETFGCDCVTTDQGVGVAICGYGEICTPCSKIGQAMMLTVGQCTKNGGVAGTTLMVSPDGYLTLEVRTVKSGGWHWNKAC